MLFIAVLGKRCLVDEGAGVLALELIDDEPVVVDEVGFNVVVGIL